MMKLYTVCRTVVFTFTVEAESPEQALVEVEGLGIGAAIEEEEIRQEVVYEEAV